MLWRTLVVPATDPAAVGMDLADGMDETHWWTSPRVKQVHQEGTGWPPLVRPLPPPPSPPCRRCGSLLTDAEIQAQEIPPRGTHARVGYCDTCWLEICRGLRGDKGTPGPDGCDGRD